MTTTTVSASVLPSLALVLCVESELTGVQGLPETGPVAGIALSGWLWGRGGPAELATSNAWPREARWGVVACEEADLVEQPSGKVSFSRGLVVFSGERCEAICYLSERRGVGILPDEIGGLSWGGEDTITEATGFRGTAIAGDFAVARAGRRGLAVAGWRGEAEVGGEGGRAIAGDRGKAVAGYGGTAEAGDRGTAIAGPYGVAIAGEGGTVQAGEGGELRLRYADTTAQRYRTAVAYVDEDGILPDVPYRLLDASTPPRFVRAEPATESKSKRRPVPAAPKSTPRRRHVVEAPPVAVAS